MIIDCFKIFIDCPTLPYISACAQTWSNYKHHNTVKFLTGISPQGSVAFILQGLGGRTSDVHLTENSGLFQKLLPGEPGDIVLADRGSPFKRQQVCTVLKQNYHHLHKAKGS